MAKRQKTALVTGASSGIGYALALELAARGYKVYAGARRLAKLQPLAAKGIVPIQMDVTSTESVDAAAALVYKETDGLLDILFNNAGIGCNTSLIDASDAQIAATLGTNVHGVLRVTRAFAPQVINAKGSVAITGLISGRLTLPFLGVYGMSKAAIAHYAATLKLELAPFGVHVVNFVAGLVATEIEDPTPLREGSLYDVDGMAEFAAARAKIFGDPALKITPEEYARKAVSDVEARGLLLEKYRGKSSLQGWYMSTFLPRFVLEHIVIRLFNLKKLWATVGKTYATKKA